MVVIAVPRQDDAFVTELERHRKILFKIARLYCADLADREDLIQEISIQLWHSYRTFDGRSQFSTWVYRVALNVAISWTRSESRRSRRTQPMENADIDSLPAMDATDGSLADRDLLENMLAQLHELDRALILLHLEGHDHITIAEILGITTTNVATKINRIKLRLQQKFG
jgi:RNA polymerase sigma factor (sigma-70 family)